MPPQPHVLGRQPQQQQVVEPTSSGEANEQPPNTENPFADRIRLRRFSVGMDQALPTGFPHQPQQTINGGIIRPGSGYMADGPVNLLPHDPPAMATPYMDLLMGALAPRLPAVQPQVNTVPSTSSATSSSITVSPPSNVVDDTPTNLATQPMMPLPPANVLTNEFMQAVASTLDDFEMQALLRSEPSPSSIDFEDFREWFNPDDLDMK